MNATTVAVDLAKFVLQLAVADCSWRVVETYRLTRTQFEHSSLTANIQNSRHQKEVLNTHPSTLEMKSIDPHGNRVHPTTLHADNSSGSLPAACIDWRSQ